MNGLGVDIQDVLMDYMRSVRERAPRLNNSGSKGSFVEDFIRSHQIFSLDSEHCRGYFVMRVCTG